MKVVTLARKPVEGSTAAGVVTHGAGAVNVDGTRLSTVPPECTGQGFRTGKFSGNQGVGDPTLTGQAWSSSQGRWPSNLILQGGEAVADLDRQSGQGRSPSTYTRTADSENVSAYGAGVGEPAGKVSLNYGDSGGASRFFFQVNGD